MQWREIYRVRRILAGDRAAGAQLVTDHYPRIRAFLYRLTGDDEESRDLTQQTFAEAWKSLPKYRGESSLSTWLHRIAYFQFTRWLRSRCPTVPLGDVDLPDPSAQGASEGLHLRLALAQLPPSLREPVLLYYEQGLSIPEVAHVMGLPQGTVKSRLHTARGQLRRLMDGDSPQKEHGHETEYTRTRT
jgi:RNA polymerase sigma-70 factor, ECF subfamily